jgi:predicted nucleic acid-binding protein
MEAGAYADSSFLVSIYRADGNHQAAISYLGRHSAAIAFTPLHRVEVRNALRNATAAGDMTKAECAMAFRQIEEDLRDGFLMHTPIQWMDTLRRADQLSEKHADTEGQRTIDLIHVAVALECGAKTFLSFDKRQRKLGKAAGLAVKP